MMERRLLQQEEKKRTRKLWEQVFSEDTPEFLDYYYNYKTKDNRIMVLEDEQMQIRAMLQLNPYQLRLGERTAATDYIIGVATDPAYRHRGYMRQLLEHMLAQMYAEQTAVTWLMPAAEAIYKPFGFQFVYDQWRGVVAAETAPFSEPLRYREMTLADGAALAQLARQQLEAGYQVYTVRDEAYFLRQLREQQSEQGGIVLVYDRDELAGYFFYAGSPDLERESDTGGQSGIEVREPVFIPTYKKHAGAVIKGYFPHINKAIKVTGLETAADFKAVEKVPMIMMRIVHLETFLKSVRAEAPVSITLRIKDGGLKENDGVFVMDFDWSGGRLRPEYRAEVAAAELCQTVTIAELTGLFTGYLDPEAYLNSENARKWKKLKLLSRIFINEVV